jgi:hypothetical protein
VIVGWVQQAKLPHRETWISLWMLTKSPRINWQQKLMQWIASHKLPPAEWIKKGGEVHLRTPIQGRPELGYVQTDFMFFPNLDWGTFFYSGGEDSAYKGMNRNVLMSSIAKQLGLKVGANGMFSRSH